MCRCLGKMEMSGRTLSTTTSAFGQPSPSSGCLICVYVCMYVCLFVCMYVVCMYVSSFTHLYIFLIYGRNLSCLSMYVDYADRLIIAGCQHLHFCPIYIQLGLESMHAVIFIGYISSEWVIADLGAIFAG